MWVRDVTDVGWTTKPSSFPFDTFNELKKRRSSIQEELERRLFTNSLSRSAQLCLLFQHSPFICLFKTNRFSSKVFGLSRLKRDGRTNGKPKKWHAIQNVHTYELRKIIQLVVRSLFTILLDLLLRKLNKGSLFIVVAAFFRLEVSKKMVMDQ